MYLELNLDIDGKDLRYRRIGHALIDYVEVEIGGQTIDKQYGEWMDLWAQLTHTKEQAEKLDRLISADLSTQKDNVKKLYIPLQFWFNRNPGLALPLIALQYHEVKLNIMFKKHSILSLFDENNVENKTILPKIDSACLFCDYIFLDTDERRRFAQGSHEYLIEQVQFNGRHSMTSSESTANIELRFNHPCKEIVWVVQNSRVLRADNKITGVDEPNTGPFNYKRPQVTNDKNREQVKHAVLQLNGHDRFRQREGNYFRCVQPLQHHTGGHDQDLEDKGGFYMYSFALKPEEHQPSGSCNFSRIDNAVLTLDINQPPINSPNEVRVYATNYNVLRIMSGMGGLAYSN